MDMATENPTSARSAKARRANSRKSTRSTAKRAAGSDSGLQPLVRIAPGTEGVSIWSSALFSDPQNSQLREFLMRVFSVKEVGAVEIRRADSFGRVLYDSV